MANPVGVTISYLVIGPDSPILTYVLWVPTGRVRTKTILTFSLCATLWQKNMLSLQSNIDSYDAILEAGRRPLL